MKIVFAGTPAFAVKPLLALLGTEHTVVGVVTQPDKPQGRKGIPTPPPVKQAALAHGIPVLQPQRLRAEVEALRALGGELLVTCAYGQILSDEVLSAFARGVYNIHASLLPRYRGASPIQWAVINGDRETGITVMRTVRELDAGEILLQRAIPVGEDTAGELSERLSALGAACIVEAVSLLARGGAALTPQRGEVSFVKKIGREDAHIDFSRPAREIVCRIRGMNPSPVAFALAEGQVLNVFRAEAVDWTGDEAVGTVLSDRPKQGLLVKCLDGAVKLTEVQLSGGKRMAAADFLNGRKLGKGQVLV